MQHDWEHDLPFLSHIHVSANPNNEPVTVTGASPQLRCVGVGTDAAVFQSVHAPKYVYKVYTAESSYKVAKEAAVYEQLAGAHYFPTCFAAADRYLVLSYEEGTTLYDCLIEGIHIPASIVDEVEEARTFIRSKGLNPRDIHLKNIVLQHGHVKILDVSEYVVDGNDYRWEYLKLGYEQYYSFIDGVSVPIWIMTTIQKWYSQRKEAAFSYEEFTKLITRFLPKK